MNIIYFIFAFFIAFFILFILVKHDFLLLRKNVLLENVFNKFFLSFIFFFIIGRLFFIFDSLSFYLINPLAFLHIFKFPGFSIFGGILGIIIFLLFIFMKNLNILGRIFDIFSLSFYSIFLLSLLFVYFSFYIKFFCFILLSVIFYFLINSYKSYSLKDGSISLIIFNSFLIFSFFIRKGVAYLKIFKYFDVSDLGSIFLILILIMILILNQTKFTKKNV